MKRSTIKLYSLRQKPDKIMNCNHRNYNQKKANIVTSKLLQRLMWWFKKRWNSLFQKANLAAFKNFISIISWSLLRNIYHFFQFAANLWLPQVSLEITIFCALHWAFLAFLSSMLLFSVSFSSFLSANLTKNWCF